MRRALFAVAVVLAAVSPAPAARAQSSSSGQPASTTHAHLALVDQTPTVGVGGDVVLRLRVDRSGLPPTADVTLTVYKAVQTRSEFQQTLSDTMTRGQAVAPVSFLLSSLPPDATGNVVVHLSADLGSDDGVFPVRVDLRDRPGSVLERFVTHVVYLTGSHTGPKLGVSFVFPVKAGVSLPPDGPRQVPGLDDLLTAITALDSARAMPFAIQPSAETLTAVSSLTDDRSNRAMDLLRRVAVDHPVAAGTYVPVSLPALLSSGLETEVGTQMDRASASLSDLLHAKVDDGLWVQAESFDPESVDELVRRGIDQVVVAESALEPVDMSLTLSRPFVLAGREEDVPAVSADEGLGGYFNGDANQALQAEHLLADLAVLWLDAPASNRRAVVALPPAEWRATRPFMDTLAAGLTQNPIAEAVSLDSVFSGVTPAVTARGTGLVRHPADTPAGGLGEVVPEIRQARARLTSLATVLPGPSPSSSLLEERLLVAESSELRGSKPRQSYVSAVDTGINDHLGSIQMPSGRSITLTARRGQIPVTFQNRTGTPAKVIVTVQSDKLEFPDGASRPLELTRRNTTERFSVVARTSGAFPLRITLVSPDGNLTIGRARLTVRSTAASGVSLAVSVGAAVFLAVWWGRHIVRGRRAKKLVPA